ncbi:hypothetical protein B0H19DRAFT_1138177 [Mycena capillaripes]|nr:hypothetical protein B0H19DRAFT_1138177 [Mycena capillaripes]
MLSNVGFATQCAGCYRVAYCSPDCQSADRDEHKAICDALKSVEDDTDIAPRLLSIANTPTTDIVELKFKTESHDQIVINKCESFIGRSLTDQERNLIVFAPRCMACTRTDQIIRIDSKINPDSACPHCAHCKVLSSCPDCNLVFYCSKEHWDVAKALHHAPCAEGHDGLSQCELNKEVRLDIGFETRVLHGTGRPFIFFPETRKDVWTALKDSSWERELGDELQSAVPPGAVISLGRQLRPVSKVLTMAMTILFALEHLNSTDEWTRQGTLTVHILGAAEPEVMCLPLFEEILHRLPAVKTLKLVLCGPEAEHHPDSQLQTCLVCEAGGRKLYVKSVDRAYHSFVAEQGYNFEFPDLAIAFNSGLSQEETGSWLRTVKILVEKKIPSLYTSYDESEAKEEAELLRTTGATLVLGPCKNPWGSLQLIPQPSTVYGFYSLNGWIAGGFR